TLARDRLGAGIVQRSVPPRRVDGHELSKVIDVVSVSDAHQPVGQDRLSATDWIVGLSAQNLDGVEQREWVRGDILSERLARTVEGQTVHLLVYNSNSPSAQPRVVPVRMGRTELTSRLLGELAEKIPDPGIGNLPGRFPLFVGLLAVVLVITCVRAVFTFIQEYLVGTAIWRGIMDLRCRNYNVVLHLPTTFFSEKGVSDATSRFIQDTNELARGQNTLLGKTMVEPAKAVGAVVMALWASWELTLMAMVAGPPAFFLIRKMGKKMHKASRRALESWSSMLAVLNETLVGIRVVKSYTMEGAERRRFFRVNRALLKQQTRMERLDAATGPTVESLGIAAGMVAAGAAGYLVFNYRMDQAVFLTWMVALFALFDPVRKLAKVSMRFQASEAAAKRIFELQDSEQEKFVPGAPSLPRHSRDIEFRNVTFRYPGAADDAVRDVSLTIRAGQTVAIVGPNGCGKTTLVSHVPRLLDPTAGQVLVDGQDITQVSVRSLRRQIGLVTQDTVLFHATMRENIAYGLRRPHDKDVLAAAKRAFVDEFVRDLPDGYDTMVGEYGATLSGGQKQRIAIARAILRDPAILIFDEAMSQVDADSERRIHQAMQEFIRGRTTLMIAHRFATVLSADMIVVMNDGRVIDTGTHQELLDRCELYQHLYRTQFVDSGGTT
ncbi:MAG TPA: ABC transporter ATP-binding protein, partial [Phycisphaerae bacterium]|nr:ABC transporter ATP-binding protein [Phycisphaerae bacterium]